MIGLGGRFRMVGIEGKTCRLCGATRYGSVSIGDAALLTASD